MCFEKNILCADVFCVFNWFETIQHQPSARRFGEEKLPWFTEAITNDLTNNGDVDDQLNALFRIKERFRGQKRYFLVDFFCVKVFHLLCSGSAKFRWHHLYHYKIVS